MQDRDRCRTGTGAGQEQVQDRDRCRTGTSAGQVQDQQKTDINRTVTQKEWEWRYIQPSGSSRRHMITRTVRRPETAANKTEGRGNWYF